MKKLIIFSIFISTISLIVQEPKSQQEWNRLAEEFVEILKQTPVEKYETIRTPFLEECKFLEKQMKDMIPEDPYSTYYVSSNEAEHRTSVLLNWIHSCNFSLAIAGNKHNAYKNGQAKLIRSLIDTGIGEALIDYSKQINHNADYEELENIISAWNKEHIEEHRECKALSERVKYFIANSYYLLPLEEEEYRRDVILDYIHSCLIPLSMHVNSSNISNHNKAVLIQNFSRTFNALEDYDRAIDSIRANRGTRKYHYKENHKTT